MKITFLGTSHGVPAADRFCSAAMVEIGEAVYLIDGGAPTGDLLIREGISYDRIKAVFTTHIHGDHTLGMLGMLSLANWKFRTSSFVTYLATEEGIDAFKKIIEVTDSPLDESRLPLKLTVPGAFYDDGVLKVTAIPTRHMEAAGKPTYALVLEAEGKRVIFTGDMHHKDAADFPQIAKDEPSDLIVCEMAHFGHDVIIPIAASCPTKMLMFNHVWWNYEESMAGIKAADGRYAMPIVAVEDGDIYEL
ncbi:MAG: MBL fold metallo-hydrolase [Oscillospiraceae bacterium]|nr:MBL fold metallo-hydrolase [Oscillospiraceae bacterium]